MGHDRSRGIIPARTVWVRTGDLCARPRRDDAIDSNARGEQARSWRENAPTRWVTTGRGESSRRGVWVRTGDLCARPRRDRFERAWRTVANRLGAGAKTHPLDGSRPAAGFEVPGSNPQILAEQARRWRKNAPTRWVTTSRPVATTAVVGIGRRVPGGDGWDPSYSTPFEPMRTLHPPRPIHRAHIAHHSHAPPPFARETSDVAPARASPRHLSRASRRRARESTRRGRATRNTRSLRARSGPASAFTASDARRARIL